MIFGKDSPTCVICIKKVPKTQWTKCLGQKKDDHGEGRNLPEKLIARLKLQFNLQATNINLERNASRGQTSQMKPKNQ